MNTEKNPKGLRISHSVLILFMMIAVMIGVYSFLGVLNIEDSVTNLLGYILSFGLSTFIAIKIYEKHSGNYRLDISTRHLKLLPLLILLPVLLQFGLASHIVNLIPMPESVKQTFYELGSSYSWSTLVSTIILAPILEEIIFRGVILKGLLKRNRPLIAILVSSLIFGLVHLNPWQFIGAFGIGIFSGWIFYKTRNIILPIMIHAANNFFFTLFGAYYGASYLVDKPMREVFGSIPSQIFAITSCLVLFFAIIFYLDNRFKKHNASLT